MKNEKIIIKKSIGLKRELKNHDLILVEHSDGYYIALDTFNRNELGTGDRTIIAKADNTSDLCQIWSALIDIYSSGFADGLHERY